MNPYKKIKAFSLLELITVLVIIGLVVAIGLPGINKARANAEIETMRTRAAALQTAKTAYINALGHDAAATNWTNAVSDEARYDNILYPYLPNTYPNGTGSDLAALIPPPYYVILGALDSTVVLWQDLNSNNTRDTGEDIPLQKF